MLTDLMTLPDLMPTEFTDSIKSRASINHRFKIGNPYAYLNSVGVESIIEEFCKGDNIVGVAKKLNVSIVLLMHWIEASGHSQRIEEAIKLSAEGYINKAADSILDATNDFCLKKARELNKLYTFIASKVNRKKYGQEVDRTSGAMAVQFIMHIGDDVKRTSVQTVAYSPNPPPEMQSLDGVFMIIPDAAGNEATDVAAPDSFGPFMPEPFIPDANTMPKYLNPLRMMESED